MKKYIFGFCVALMFLSLTSNLSAQGFKSIYIAGGVNHIPVEGFFRFPSSEFNRRVDKISFSGSIGIFYEYTDRAEFTLGMECISTNIGYYFGNGSTNWIIKSMPIILGYNYTFYKNEKLFNIYGGIGLSFVIIKTEWNLYADIIPEEQNYTNETYGVDVRCGIMKSIAHDLNLFVEAKYRFHGDVEVNKMNPGRLVNFSGLGILIGFSIDIFN